VLVSGWVTSVEFCQNKVCRTVTYDSTLNIAAGLVYAGVFAFLIPAWVMAALALCRLRGVAIAGVAPQVGCCMPSAPAIQATAWTGLIFVTVGCSYAWFKFDELTKVFPSAMATAGSSYLAFAFCTITLACLLFSLVGCCCVGHMPGLGRARTNGCCGENDLDAPESTTPALGHYEHSYAKNNLAVRSPGSSMSVSV